MFLKPCPPVTKKQISNAGTSKSVTAYNQLIIVLH